MKPVEKNAKDVQLENVSHHGAGVVHEGGEFITTNQGLRVSDDLNSERAGSRGPTLLEDFILREKITHFDHERIPERVVHARGAAAHGVFQVYEDLSDLTQAKFLTDPSKQTPVFLRFSTVAGSRGSADTARDVRGFAVKFYTEEGNFDLVGNNIPVFFIQDAIKFPDLIHAVKPEPNNEIPQASSAHDTFYDFISLTPESAHMLMWVMSDRAIPRSYRMMEGFGVHTFRLVNAEGKARFIKWHFKPLLGVHGLAWDEAQKLAGKDPDFHRRDLWDAIEQGHFPEWELGIQVLEQEDEFKFDFDLLDSTKIWPEDLVPVRRIGKLTLNRNPDNYFAETEQVAFHLGHVVPGIDFTNDPLLQGRLFSYTDTQITRLGGPNFAEIPINRPVCPIHNYQRDGLQQQGIPKGRVSYSPNTLGGGCPMQASQAQGGYVSYPERVEGNKVRERSKSFGDHFTQARLFYNSMTAPEKQHIADAIWFELSKVETKEIQKRMLELYNNIDHDLAAYVAQGIGMDTPAKVDTSQGSRKAPALSMEEGPKGDITTRKVAILAADGVDASAVTQLQQALHAGGAMAEIISLRLAPIVSADGQHLPVGKIFHSTPSVQYDAVFVPGGAKSAQALADAGDAVQFISEMFKHGKPIGASGEGVQLLTEANLKGATLADTSAGKGVVSNLGVVTGATDTEGAAVVQDFVKALGQGRFWDRQKNAIPA